MALSLSFNAHTSTDCLSIEIEDTTGAYSSTNTGGWGSPNKTIAEVVSVDVIITDPANGEYTIDGFPTLPNVIGTELSIPNTSLGLLSTDKIADGIWYINYFITFDDDTTAQLTLPFLFYCEARCCVQKMLPQVEVSDCDYGCNETKLNNAVKAKTYLDAAIQAAECSKPNQAQIFLDLVNYICNKENCGC